MKRKIILGIVLQDKAQDYILERYDWDKVVEETKELYKR